MAHINTTPLLRGVLRLDAALSALTAAALIGGEAPLATWADLPPALLQGLGLALLPWAGWLAWLGSRAAVPRAAIGAVVVLNFCWVLDCALLGFGAFGSPQPWGIAIAAVQGVGTFALAELEWLAMKRAPAAPAPLRGAFAG